MVQMLKPRLTAANTQRGTMLAANPGATPRTRGTTWMTIRAKWFRAHPLCCVCEAAGLARMAEELDHVIPLASGGADDDSNYQSLCVECHRAKSKREARIINGMGYAP